MGQDGLPVSVIIYVYICHLAGGIAVFSVMPTKEKFIKRIGHK